MKEAFGNSFITIIVITFMSVLILILASSSSYSKAAKVRNRIIEMIENNQGYNNGLVSIDVFEEQINEELAKYGYRVNVSATNNCKVRDGLDSNLQPGENNVHAINGNSKYSYCVYEFRTVKGVYYGVETYMYFDIPLIDNIEIGIYGETKTLYDFELKGWEDNI